MLSNRLTINSIKLMALLGIITLSVSCSDLFEFELPDSNSQVDTELPDAQFEFAQDKEVFNLFSFKNNSSESLRYLWDFGTGETSSEENPNYVFQDGVGTYTVTLTASDLNGASSTLSRDVVVEELPDDLVPDPIIINEDFDELPKSSGSDCACSGWINKSIGEQGETSSGNDNSVVKFDNLEPDHIYQEFAVVPNADYRFEMPVEFKNFVDGGQTPSMLEIRILAGTGYVDGYTPTYYTETVEFPQDGYGYTTVAQFEDPANNLHVEVLDNPGMTGYISYDFQFNVGANTSIALFVRGIGGPAGGDYDYNSGDEEIRAEFVRITAIN